MRGVSVPQMIREAVPPGIKPVLADHRSPLLPDVERPKRRVTPPFRLRGLSTPSLPSPSPTSPSPISIQQPLGLFCRREAPVFDLFAIAGIGIRQRSNCVVRRHDPLALWAQDRLRDFVHDRLVAACTVALTIIHHVAGRNFIGSGSAPEARMGEGGKIGCRAAH
jgi:hypothetical protein